MYPLFANDSKYSNTTTIVGLMCELSDFACHTLNYSLGKTGPVTVVVVVCCGVNAMSALGLALSLMLLPAKCADATIVSETEVVANVLA